MGRPKNKRQYDATAKSILKKISDGNDLSCLDQWETEIAVECAERGFITKPKYATRTENGILHAEFVNPKLLEPGMVFLYTKHPNLRANIAIVISILALLISLTSWITNALANLDKLIPNWKILVELMKSQ